MPFTLLEAAKSAVSASASASPATSTHINTIATTTTADADSCTAAVLAQCSAAYLANFVKIRVHDNKPAVIGLGVVLGLVLLSIGVFAIWVRYVHLPRRAVEMQHRIDEAVTRALLEEPGARFLDRRSLRTLQDQYMFHDANTLVGCNTRDSKMSDISDVSETSFGTTINTHGESPQRSTTFEDDDELSFVPTRSYRYPSGEKI